MGSIEISLNCYISPLLFSLLVRHKLWTTNYFHHDMMYNYSIGNILFPIVSIVQTNFNHKQFNDDQCKTGYWTAWIQGESLAWVWVLSTAETWILLKKFVFVNFLAKTNRNFEAYRLFDRTKTLKNGHNFFGLWLNFW